MESYLGFDIDGRNPLILKAIKNAPVHEDVFKSKFITDLKNAMDLYGDIDMVAENNNKIGTIEFGLMIASEAVKIIENTSYKNWTEKVEDELRLWARSVWRFCLIAPVGYIVNDSTVYSSKNNYSWDPVRSNFINHSKGGVPKRKASNRALKAEMISACTSMRMFNDIYQWSGIMQGQAFVNAFDSKGSSYNPIRGAFKRSIKKVLNEVDHQNLPEWWVSCIYDYGVNDDEEAVETVKVNKVKSAEIKDSKKDEPFLKAGNEAIKTKLSDVEKGIVRMADEENAFNVKGSLFHIYNNTIWAKHPLIGKVVSEKVGVHEEIINSGDLFDSKTESFNVIPEGEVVAIMKMRSLNPRLQTVLKANVAKYGNNEDLESVN